MTELNLDRISQHVVTDAKAAAFLVNPEGQRFLTPFLEVERTVSSAAQDLGIPTNSLLYRVKQMVSLGILGVVRQEARAGRALKIYRSVANAFFVPFELTDAATLQDLLSPLDAHWQKLFARNSTKVLLEHSPDLGLQLWRGETGELYIKPAEGAGKLLDFAELPMFAFWSAGLFLDDEAARNFRTELLELYQRYSNRESSKPKRRYITHLALAPWVLDEAPG